MEIHPLEWRPSPWLTTPPHRCAPAGRPPGRAATAVPGSKHTLILRSAPSHPKKPEFTNKNEKQNAESARIPWPITVWGRNMHIHAEIFCSSTSPFSRVIYKWCQQEFSEQPGGDGPSDVLPKIGTPPPVARKESVQRSDLGNNPSKIAIFLASAGVLQHRPPAPRWGPRSLLPAGP